MKKVCLITITASHYRKRIYQLMDQHLNCHFLMGLGNSNVKRLDTKILNNSIDITNHSIGKTNVYYQEGAISKTKDYDIIIDDSGIMCLTSWLLILMSKFRRQKIYMWSHGWYGREGIIKKWIKRAYSAWSDGMLVYGNYAKKLMIENGFNADKLVVIHNSLDYDAQKDIRDGINENDIYKKHFGNCNPTIVFIGRLTKEKRLDLVVHSIYELKKQERNYNLVIIGDGEDDHSLKNLVSTLNLEKQVWFYGACYDEHENAELIYNADLCVSPGNVGLTAIHTMMFGTPVITHNDFPYQGPEFEAIQPGITGDFFERGDIMSLVGTIKKWFDNKKDKREEVRNACFKEIDNEWNPHLQLRIIKDVIYG